MLLVFQFTQLRPRCLPEYEARFQHALSGRAKLSSLGGFWRTEVGNIDQVVQLWAYEDTQHCDRVLKAAATLEDWAAIEARELVLEQWSRHVVAPWFSPAIEERTLGAIYELRIYDYDLVAIPKVIQVWQEKLPARVELSPLVACGHSASGRLGQWFHLWGYADAVERQRIRAEAIERKVWPPGAGAGLIRQRNMLLVPAPFSPLR